MPTPILRALIHCLCGLLLLTAAQVTAQVADPATSECLAAYERSVSLRAAHALRDARTQLLACAAPTCPADVRNECALRVSEVNSQIPTLVFEAQDHARSDLSQVKVSMDGHPLAQKLDGSALSVDPGEHRFVFEVAGSAPVEKSLVLREGEKDRRERVVLGAPPLQPPEPDNIPVPLSPVGEPAPRAAGNTTLRVVGALVTAIGIAGLSVALYEQVSARARYADSQRAAESYDPALRATTHTLYTEAQHAQTFALVSGGLGLAAAATGTYLLLSSLGDEPDERAPRASAHVAPWLAAHGGGLTCAGGF